MSTYSFTTCRPRHISCGTVPEAVVCEGPTLHWLLVGSVSFQIAVVFGRSQLPARRLSAPSPMPASESRDTRQPRLIRRDTVSNAGGSCRGATGSASPHFPGRTPGAKRLSRCANPAESGVAADRARRIANRTTFAGADRKRSSRASLARGSGSRPCSVLHCLRIH